MTTEQPVPGFVVSEQQAKPKKKKHIVCKKCGEPLRCQKVWHPNDDVTVRIYVCDSCKWRMKAVMEHGEIYILRKHEESNNN